MNDIKKTRIIQPAQYFNRLPKEPVAVNGSIKKTERGKFLIGETAIAVQKPSKISSRGTISALTLFGLLFGSSVALAGGTHIKEDLFGTATKYLRLASTFSSIVFGTVLAAAGLPWISKDKNSNIANVAVY